MTVKGELLRVTDGDGSLLLEGARVRSTGAETPFIHTQTGEVAGFRTGPPVVEVIWDRLSPRPYMHSVDLMWRCPDLELIDPPTSKQEASK